MTPHLFGVDELTPSQVLLPNRRVQRRSHAHVGINTHATSTRNNAHMPSFPAAHNHRHMLSVHSHMKSPTDTYPQAVVPPPHHILPFLHAIASHTHNAKLLLQLHCVSTRRLNLPVPNSFPPLLQPRSITDSSGGGKKHPSFTRNCHTQEKLLSNPLCPCFIPS